MKNRKLIIALMAGTVLLTGCSTAREELPVDLIKDIPGNSCYVYVAPNNDIAAYDKKEQKVQTYTIDAKNKYQNTFFYTSDEVGKIYSVGDSVEGGFTLVELKEDSYKIIYEENNKNVAFFPIAQNSKQTFLSVEETKDGEIEGGLMMYTKEEGITSFDNIDSTEVILCGALGDDCLYYTTYHDDDTFYLYEFDYMDSECTPKLLKDDLSTPEIFYYNGEVSYYVEDKITIGAVTLDYTPDVYRCEDLLIVFRGVKDGKSDCEVFDLKTGDITLSMELVVGYSLDEESVFIYTLNDGRKEVRINE